MKVKRIEIKSLDEVLTETKEVMKALSEGKSVEPSSYVAFDNLGLVTKVLTKERMALLRAIKQHNPSSIRELAKLVGRNYKNVHSDVMLLSKYGILELKREGKSQKPRFDYEELEITVPIG